MLLKPQLLDLKIIAYYLGRVVIVLGVSMFIPLLVGFAFGETAPAIDFVISIVIAFIVGIGLVGFFHTDSEPRWIHAMIVASVAWILAMFLGAIPLYLSGHWSSYLNACFDSMSGFATTGLTLVEDLDHLSYTHNFWRHLIMFIGGVGIIVVALSFLVHSSSFAFRIYVGEARDEKILPNVISTARFILSVSIIYFIIGTGAFVIVGLYEGLSIKNAIFHGCCIFMAAFNTGGFSPSSQNILYYHSFSYEILTCIFMLLGAMNFKLHYALWSGNKREIFRNIEIVTLFFSIIITFIITGVGLKLNNVYPNVFSFFRKGFYQLISAHTGTGYMTIYASQFLSNWSSLAIFGIIIAMAIGGSSCSTTGAIKTLRIGLIYKGLVEDIKKTILPESAIINEKFHHIKDIVLKDKHIRLVALITFAYIALYFFGAIIGIFFGYPFLDSLFESVSAGANVGLSCGITKPDMPTLLKITYIFQMWIGRLEFMSVFSLFGFLWATIKGRR